MKEHRNPSQPPGPEVDPRTHRVELTISNLLRFGVITSLVLVAIGVILSYTHNPAYLSSPAALRQITSEGAVFPSTWHAVVNGVLTLQGEAIILVGLLFLIATPIARVAVSILAFIYQKDRVYTFITIVVLCLLVLSFLLGKVE